MRHPFLLLTLPAFAIAIAAVACSDATSSNNDDVADGGGSSVVPPGSEPSSTSPEGPAGSGLATGLPCDVQGVLENRCIACHSGTFPPPLLKYDDLKAPSKKYPGKTMAEAAVAELKAKSMPPAPAVAPEDDEVASFEEWVNGGTQKNAEACTTPPPPANNPPAGDGGATPDGGADGGAGGVVCSSGKMWMGGNNGSPLMNPGEACNACHQQQGGPNLRIGGTVYKTAHEPNDCNGSAPPPVLRVVVTDSRNQTFNMTVNAAGNFLTQNGARPRPPLKAMVTDGQKTRQMQGTVTSGDCNSCHTVNGANGAPGRIMAP